MVEFRLGQPVIELSRNSSKRSEMELLQLLTKCGIESMLSKEANAI